MSKVISIGKHQVGRMGYGCMGLTTAKPHGQEPDWKAGIAAIKAAAESGSTLFNTATFYGTNHPHDNLHLLQKFYAENPEWINKTVVLLKGGVAIKNGQLSHMEINLENVREEVEAAQKALGDQKKIDIYELGRLPKDQPIENVMNMLKALRDEGHFSAIGLSEAKGSTVLKAIKVVPIASVEIEVSLWSLEDDIQECIKTCTEQKIPVVAYSPLGRGMLTGKWKSMDDMPKDSRVRMWPRFQGENFKKNFELVEKIEAIAQKKGITKSQLALSYILDLSPEILPIPGSSNPERIAENIKALDIHLSAEEKDELEAILKTFTPSGGRYPDAFVDQLVRFQFLLQDRADDKML